MIKVVVQVEVDEGQNSVLWWWGKMVVTTSDRWEGGHNRLVVKVEVEEVICDN